MCATVACISHFARTLVRWRFAQSDTCSRIIPSTCAGNGTPSDIDTMLDICDNIFGRSFCALGDGAVSPIQSGIKYFRDEFLALCDRNKTAQRERELAGAR